MLKRVTRADTLEIYEDDRLILTLSETVSSDEVRICVAGEVSASVAHEMEDELMAAVSFCTALWIDLSGVSGMAEAAVQSLLTVQRTADEIGVRVAILMPSPAVKTVLEDHGFYQIMEICD